jgi:hypothetical protein
VLRQRSSQPTRRLTRWSFILLGQRFTRTRNPARRCMRMQASTTQSATALAQPTHSLPQVMNADRFDGPYANLCDRQPAKAASSNSSSSSGNNSGGGSYSNSQVRILTNTFLLGLPLALTFFIIFCLIRVQFVGSVVGASFGSAIVASIFTWQAVLLLQFCFVFNIFQVRRSAPCPSRKE